MELNHSGATCLGEVSYPRLQRGEGTRRQVGKLPGIEPFSHSHPERPGDHGDVLDRRMKMSRYAVAVRHAEAHGIWSGLAGITLQNGQFCTGREDSRRRSPGDPVG